jgi:hypothetical protein
MTGAMCKGAWSLGTACGECSRCVESAKPFIVELERQIAGYQHHLHKCEQIAGRALGYPWFKDDQANFPGATEADGVCVGDHVGDTIVEELATRLADVIKERDEADRRAGAAERRLEWANDSIQKRAQWLDKAKDQLGYHRNVSFDRVWDDLMTKIASGDKARAKFSERVSELRGAVLALLVEARENDQCAYPVGANKDKLDKIAALIECQTCHGMNVVTGPWGVTDCLDCNPPLQVSDVR